MAADHPFTITTKPRNLKLLFFVRHDFSKDSLVKLLLNNLRIWGGRYNPIVPVYNGEVNDGWKSFLTYQDPDYIYYTKGIDRGSMVGLCDEIGLYPTELIELDERQEIKGVHIANLMPYLSQTGILEPKNLWEVENPLKDYFKLNFLVEDSFPANHNRLQNHMVIPVGKDNFASIHHHVGEHRFFRNTLISGYNTQNWQLRLAQPDHHAFELVIGRDDNPFEELIYHWNKESYATHHRELQTVFLTYRELDLLLQDDYFKKALKTLSGDQIKINIVSFSLTGEELEQAAKSLQGFAVYNQFEVKDRSNFPFAIMDREGLHQKTSNEKSEVQVIQHSHPFIFLPQLSFRLEFTPFTQAYAVDLRIAEVLSPFNQILRFPRNLNTQFYVEKSSRVRRNREIAITINQSDHLEGKLQLTIPKFFDVVRSVVINPRITGSDDFKNIYYDVRYSDGSNRMAQFLKLFNNNFSFVEEFIGDKFWNDIFLKLTDNSRTEGDTILFENIFEECQKIMIETGKEIKAKGESRFNLENLRKGLTDTIQELTDHKIFLPGFIIKCRHCASKIWYSLSEIQHAITCKGCSNINHFAAENPIAYKLNHLVKNNIGMKNDEGKFMPDGNMTAIRTLVHLRNSSPGSFQYLPQIDIYGCDDQSKPKTDLDIIAMVGGKLFIGECKHTSSKFHVERKKSLDNLLELALTIQPDKIILSCSKDNGTDLNKAVNYLRSKISDWKCKPEIVPYRAWTPDYFGTNEYRYFRF
ncbi:hypothetical protein KXQ82_04245 [Mucilaginibacter sp. HMF5004]|uniref:hypothetical protein n=1 Tax=Mucilaginibacter rivuli TaxID=2857527 RepID=UPI001C5DC57B|nr:hypothetical protein [Mucilaginibacter rivuli]MBW4888907.1 hypothetical protein [Mucilaginibacter rivuli]